MFDNTGKKLQNNLSFPSPSLSLSPSPSFTFGAWVDCVFYKHQANHSHFHLQVLIFFFLIVLGSLGLKGHDLLEQDGEAAQYQSYLLTSCPASQQMCMRLITRGATGAQHRRSRVCLLLNLEAGLWFSLRPKQCKKSQRNYSGHLGTGRTSYATVN